MPSWKTVEKFAAHDARLERLEMTATTTQQQIDALTAEATQAKADFDSFLTAEQAKLAALQAQITALQGQTAPNLTALQSAVDAAKADVDAALAAP